MAKQPLTERIREEFSHIETRFRPDLRWWLAEGLNTDETLKKNVRQIHDSGFGAAEFLAMPEPGADSSVYGWGSEEWTADTQLIVREATELGLGFSLTNGAHWATANLPDTFTWQGEPYGPDHKAASQELDYATVLIAPGEAFSGVLPEPVRPAKVGGDAHGSAVNYKKLVFQGVVAAKLLEVREECGQAYGYAEGRGTGVLDASSLLDVTNLVKEENGVYSIDFAAPADGTYALFVYWMHGTCQTASPSVATNYAINYMDRYGIDALKDYWNSIVLTDELREVIRRNGRGEIYMDSLELVTYGAGGIFWGYDFKKEFASRKGYDLTRYLPLVTMDKGRITSGKPKVYDYTAPGDEAADLIRKVRNDYYNVMSQMYVENVLEPLADWLHGLGMTLRAEPSYGVNFEISTPARAIDGIETESFAQTADIDLYRGLSGSANMYGRLFSSETGAVEGHNYYFSMDTWTSLCYLQFAEGVNRTVFHGYSAIEGSEEATYWPGHEGMYPRFSERFNCRQPASIHYPEWTEMLGRAQKALRKGTALRDLAILRTDYFFVNYGKPEEHRDFTKNFMMYDKAYFWKNLDLQEKGYTYDYFSPQLLLDEENTRWNGNALMPEGPAYQAILLYQEDLELACAKKLLEIAGSGLPIFFVNGNEETVFHEGPAVFHKKAASKSKSLGESDEELRAVVEQIKALPNVCELDSPADVLPALGERGICPRVEISSSRPHRVITASRFDRAENRLYTFVYNYKFEVLPREEKTEVRMFFHTKGIPCELNLWNGQVTQVPFKVIDGRIAVEYTLKPGMARMLAVDLGATDPEIMQAALEATAPREAVESLPLERFDITLEDWNEGEKIVNVERKFGHETREAYFTTKKTELYFPGTRPVAWKDLPASPEQLAKLAGEAPSLADVSGVARYRTTVTVPETWTSGIRLRIAEDGGGTVMVYANGRKTGLIPHRDKAIDLTGYLHPGENELVLEATSTLTNRMRQRGYRFMGSRWTDDFPGVQSYGVQGVVLERTV